MLLKLQPPQGLHYSSRPSMPVRHGTFASQDIFSKSAQQSVPSIKFGNDDITTYIDNSDIQDSHLIHQILKALAQAALTQGSFFKLMSTNSPLPKEIGDIQRLGAGLSGTAFELPKTNIGNAHTAAIVKIYHGPNEVRQSREALAAEPSSSTPMSQAMLDEIVERIKQSADKEEEALTALNTNINALSSVIREEEKENLSQNKERLDTTVKKIIQNGYDHFPKLYGRGLLEFSTQLRPAEPLYQFLLLQKINGEPFDFFDRERHQIIEPTRLIKATELKGLQALLTTIRALDVLGILHGDLKSANILWQQNNDENFEGPVGIIDFGNSALFDVFKPLKAQDKLNVPSFVRPTNLFSFEVKYLFPLLSQLLAIQDNHNFVKNDARLKALRYISDYFKAERDYLMREELRLPSVINNGQYTESQQQKYAEVRSFDKLRLFAFEDFAVRRNLQPAEARLLNQLSHPFSRLELMRIQMIYADTMATVYKGQPDGERVFRDWSLMALMNTLEYLYYCQPKSKLEIEPKGNIRFALTSDKNSDRNQLLKGLLSGTIATDDIYVEVSPSDSSNRLLSVKQDFTQLYWRQMYDWGIHWLEKLLIWDVAAGMHLPLKGSRIATGDLRSIVDNLPIKEALELSEFKGPVTRNRNNLDSTLRSFAEAMLTANIKPSDLFLLNQKIPILSKEKRTPDRIMRSPHNIVDTLLGTDTQINEFRSLLLPKQQPL